MTLVRKKQKMMRLKERKESKNSILPFNMLLFSLIIYGCETFYDIIGVYFGQNIELCNDFVKHWSVEILTHSPP